MIARMNQSLAALACSRIAMTMPAEQFTSQAGAPPKHEAIPPRQIQTLLYPVTCATRRDYFEVPKKERSGNVPFYRSLPKFNKRRK